MKGSSLRLGDLGADSAGYLLPLTSRCMLPTMELQGCKLDGFGWFRVSRVSVNANKIGFGCKRLLRHGNFEELRLRVMSLTLHL